MKLYAPAGVFMPQNSPASVGTDAVRNPYDAVFKAITLDATVTIVEMKRMAPEWAFVRTNSAESTKIDATGDHVAENNQELFVFQKLDNAGRIARYCFSTTNPARQKSGAERRRRSGISSTASLPVHCTCNSARPSTCTTSSKRMVLWIATWAPARSSC